MGRADGISGATQRRSPGVHQGVGRLLSGLQRRRAVGRDGRRADREAGDDGNREADSRELHGSHPNECPTTQAATLRVMLMSAHVRRELRHDEMRLLW